MPRKLNRKREILKKSNFADNLKSYFSQIKWGESYISLFLGAVVVGVALILLASFVKNANLSKKIGSTSTSSVNQTVKYPKTYTVNQGENLWSISEKIYGSGYNWVDLAKANNLENPDILYVGTKLLIPNVTPKIVDNMASEKNAIKPITGSSYTVQKGDYLWSIAVRAYGDGYKWVEIAKANNLANPDIIHSGNILKLPR
jgi:putative chitinase